ncbi:MAG TPA: DUF4389 domain-containing protein [Gaiellaceae bacterium]
MSDHPIRLVVDDDLQRSRLTVFFRLLLAIPHFFWIVLWSLGVIVLAVVAWFVALVKGRLPDGLHDFFAMYVRYVTHVTAYLSIAANPYPGFTGAPGYPVDVEIPGPEQQSRWTIAFRFFLALPAFILAGVLGWSASGGGSGARAGEDGSNDAWTGSFIGVAVVCGFLGWFASVVRGRMPNGLRDLAAYGIGYSARVYAYGLLLTERYPDSNPDALGQEWSLRSHPVRLQLADDGRRSRLTVFFRLLLALPHLVWLLLWSIAALFAALANGIVALVRGRSADALHRFLSAYVRYTAHVTAFIFLVANPFPGFAGAVGYPVDISIGPAERQNRWITLGRTLLVIPALIVSGALTSALLAVGFLGWFATLATGRMPTGLRNLGAVAVRYLAQTNAYWFVVTDSYPYASPALHAPAEAES